MLIKFITRISIFSHEIIFRKCLLKRVPRIIITTVINTNKQPYSKPVLKNNNIFLNW